MGHLTWILAKIKKGTPGVSDAFPETTTLISGEVKEAELAFEEGDTKEATNIKGEVVDQKVFAGKNKFTATLFAQTLEEMATFLGVTATGTAGAKTFGFNNTLIKGFHAIDIEPEETGDIGVKMPKCRLQTGVAWSSEDGWYMPLTITPTKPATGFAVNPYEYTAE